MLEKKALFYGKQVVFFHGEKRKVYWKLEEEEDALCKKNSRRAGGAKMSVTFL